MTVLRYTVGMSDKTEAMLDEVIASLRKALGDNLWSCCLYGSAVRGNVIAGVSDLNLLIILNESNPTAHEAVARVLAPFRQIDPFLLGRRGFERSVRAFAVKFSSIQRNYRVLYGADPLAELKLDTNLERFLCEQALRNLRLRLTYAFVTRERHKAYGRFLTRCATPLMIQLSEILRLNGLVIPKEFATRIALFEKEMKLDGAPLRDLLTLKQSPTKLSDAEVVNWHTRIFSVVDTALQFVEAKWPA